MSNIHEDLKHELLCENRCRDEQKDILIVIKDGKPFVQNCIWSVLNNTRNFTLHLWYNGSNEETKNYLEFFAKNNDNIVLYRVEENLGFIRPNNEMAKVTKSPYLILLNSDTIVFDGWDRAMLGYLQEHPDVGMVGYQGGLLSGAGWGVQPAYGAAIDYLMGWCLCLPRSVYRKCGLFDEENIKFAYFEDSDLSLRVQEAGYLIYAMSLDYAKHLANSTVRLVQNDIDLRPIIQSNLQYFRKRWIDYLAEGRILLLPMETEVTTDEQLCYTSARGGNAPHQEEIANAG